MGLAREDDRPVVALEDDGLVPIDVSGRGNDVYSGRYLGLAVKQLVACSSKVDQVRDRVVGGLSSVEFDALASDRAAAEGRVAADVVEVQVAVHDDVDVVSGEAEPAESILDADALWPVPSFGLGTCITQAGVEKKQACGGARDVSKHGLDPRAAGVRLLGGPNERSQFKPGHVLDPHVTTLGQPLAGPLSAR